MRFAVVVLAAASMACANGLAAPAEAPEAGAATDRVRQLGEIKGYNNDDPRIEISTSGRTVQVVVTTYGDGCLSKGDTEVRVEGLEADITPYDYTAPPGSVCTRQLVSVRHTATVTFSGAGEATIRIHGIDASKRSAANMRGDRIVVERKVRVE